MSAGEQCSWDCLFADYDLLLFVWPQYYYVCWSQRILRIYFQSNFGLIKVPSFFMLLVLGNMCMENVNVTEPRNRVRNEFGIIPLTTYFRAPTSTMYSRIELVLLGLL